jgi:PAS domain S-box-containing protein
MENNNYLQIIDYLFEGIFIIDNDFKIVGINKAASMITGYSKDEAKGKHCYEILKTDICRIDCPIKKLKKGETADEQIINIITKKNEEKHIKLKIFPFNNNWIEIFQDVTREVELEKRINKRYIIDDIITSDEKLFELLSALPKIALSDVSVLIEGESGVGKEVFATALKNLSKRKDKPFIKINCAALPDTLLESELFGYKKGAFTDAKKDKPGLFVQAHEGTLFLDEIGDMSLPLQAKLLRAVETGEIVPLGGIKSEKVDVRIIAATNRNLSEEVENGKFREDLFYRLNVVNIKIPPLRNRKKDISLFIDYFINNFNIVYQKDIKGITKNGLNLLLNYNFPGNIRELKNIIEHAFVFCDKEFIDTDDLPDYLKNIKEDIKQKPHSFNEKNRIIEALEISKWNKKKAAELLEIDRSTLWRKMKKYGLL